MTSQMYEQPLLEVERALQTAGIDHRPEDGAGVFVGSVCPACRREDSKLDGLRMSWFGEAFVLRCVDRGCDQSSIEQALGLPPLVVESAEHAEHNGAEPHPERNGGVRVGGEHPGEQPPNTPPALAHEPRILDRFDEAMVALGLVGERTLARTVKLVATSRLLTDPGRLVVKGDSSTGKSFATECALDTVNPAGMYVRTGTSPKALFYSDEDFRHKLIAFYEANRLGDDDDELAQVLRTLISEGRLVHEVTNVEKRSTDLHEKEGPVAFITTTCKPKLDAEIETRILSLVSNNSDEQTADVVASLLNAAAQPRAKPDLSEWHELDRWLAAGECDVVLPWTAALAKFKLSGPPRLRRDISNLLALARSHALLHRATREKDPAGRIVSTLEDFEVVRELLADALAVATDKAVRPGTRKVVEAVQALKAEGKRTSVRAVSARAGRSPSTTSHDVNDALESGYLIDRSPTESRKDLDVGDPLPGKDDLLPSRADVERVFGERSASVRSDTEHGNPAADAASEASVRSVRPNPEEATPEQEAELAQVQAKFAAADDLSDLAEPPPGPLEPQRPPDALEAEPCDCEPPMPDRDEDGDPICDKCSRRLP